MEAGPTINPLETRKRRSQLPQIALAVLLLVVACAAAWLLLAGDTSEVPADKWVTHQSADGGFSVRFPREPEISRQEGGQGKREVHLATADMKNRVYAVAWSDFTPEEMAQLDTDAMLDEAASGGMKSIGGKVTDQVELKWRGCPGREFRADVPGGKAHYRIILAGQRLYQLGIIHAPDFKPDQETFFGSFHLDAKR